MAEMTEMAMTGTETKIKAKVFSFAEGLREYENVRLIRLRSSHYNILIMEDHLPVLGEVTGSVEIVTVDDQVFLENISGYYMHKKNVFELILKE